MSKIELDKMYCLINIFYCIMEKRINKKLEVFLTTMKDDIRQKINDLKINETEKVSQLIQYIYDYERLTFTNDDFDKRKRVKNSIPKTNRCSAKRANGEQCTRRKKDNCEFCGTHDKFAPHGLVDNSENNTKTKSVDLKALEINGIIYWVDQNSNVYNTEDILSHRDNPAVIANYNLLDNGLYNITFLDQI